MHLLVNGESFDVDGDGETTLLAGIISADPGQFKTSPFSAKRQGILIVNYRLVNIAHG